MRKLRVAVPEIQRTNLANTVLLLKVRARCNWPLLGLKLPISSAECCPVVCLLQSLGIVDPLNFQFLDNPAPEMLIEALLQLYYLVSQSWFGCFAVRLGSLCYLFNDGLAFALQAAIDVNGTITELGKVRRCSRF